MREYFTEETLFKVYKSLRRSGLEEQQAINAINDLQNEGILFREKEPTSNAPMVPTHRGTGA